MGPHRHLAVAALGAALVLLVAGSPAVGAVAGPAGRAPRAESATAGQAAVTDARIVQLFNAERKTAGLPPVAENHTWSADCAAHDHWMAVNGKLQHPEDPGSPAYSDAGNWAGTHAVLAEGSSWSGGDPWDTAPIHLSQMMSPLLTAVGVDESHGFDCLTTWPGYVDPTAPAGSVSWWPGSGSTQQPAETASESPTVPGVWVGLPIGTTTGPYLYLYSNGVSGESDYSDNTCTAELLTDGTYGCTPGTQADPTPYVEPMDIVSGAVLTGPGGVVPIRTVDQTVAADAGYAGYMPVAALFIPPKPLKASSTYTLTATLSSEPAPATWQTDDEVYVVPPPVRVHLTFHTAAIPLVPRVVRNETVTKARADLKVAGIKAGNLLGPKGYARVPKGHKYVVAGFQIQSVATFRRGKKLVTGWAYYPVRAGTNIGPGMTCAIVLKLVRT